MVTNHTCGLIDNIILDFLSQFSIGGGGVIFNFSVRYEEYIYIYIYIYINKIINFKGVSTLSFLLVFISNTRNILLS